MRNFDEQRQRRVQSREQFTIMGQVFTLRSNVNPNALVEYEDMTGSVKGKEALRIIDGLIEAFLVPDDAPRWRELRQVQDDPITLADMQDIVLFLVEAHTARPPTAASPSTTGSVSPTPGTLPRRDSSSEGASVSPISASASG